MLRYSGHARQKFAVLQRHGFVVTPQQVEEAMDSPEQVEPQPDDTWIAQRRIGARHVLRVVYREVNGDRVVITFYPGRRERYEGVV